MERLELVGFDAEKNESWMFNPQNISCISLSPSHDGEGCGLTLDGGFGDDAVYWLETDIDDMFNSLAELLQQFGFLSMHDNNARIHFVSMRKLRQIGAKPIYTNDKEDGCSILLKFESGLNITFTVIDNKDSFVKQLGESLCTLNNELAKAAPDEDCLQEGGFPRF